MRSAWQAVMKQVAPGGFQCGSFQRRNCSRRVTPPIDSGKPLLDQARFYKPVRQVFELVGLTLELRSAAAGRDPHVLCRQVGSLPYEREWTEPGSNRRHQDFQSCALPTELSVRESPCVLCVGFYWTAESAASRRDAACCGGRLDRVGRGTPPRPTGLAQARSTADWLGLIRLAEVGACRLPRPCSGPLSRSPPGLASWLPPPEIPPLVLPRPATGRAAELALALVQLPGAR